MTGRSRSGQVSVRSELTVARSCTVATSVPEERGHSVVDSTTTAANVGICSSRSSSTSSVLCRLDYLPNVSVNSRKISGRLCSAFSVCRLLVVQRKSAFDRILQFRRHGQTCDSASATVGDDVTSAAAGRSEIATIRCHALTGGRRSNRCTVQLGSEQICQHKRY